MSVERLFPKLVVADADAAIDFYVSAFGAELVERYTDGSGNVVHALLRAGTAVWGLKDADDVDPAPTGPGSVLLALDVDDPDATAAAMLAGGGRVIFEVADHEYGQRGGRLADPFGHSWMIAARTEDVAPEEIQRRVERAYP